MGQIWKVKEIIWDLNTGTRTTIKSINKYKYWSTEQWNLILEEVESQFGANKLKKLKILKCSYFYWLVSVRKIKLMIKLLPYQLRWIKTRLKMEVDKNSSECYLNPFFRNSICEFDYKIACIIHIRFFHYNWASIVKTHHLFLLSLNLFFCGWVHRLMVW